MTVARFQDLIAWQLARQPVKTVYVVTSKGRLAQDPWMADQMRRAAVSTMANLAEGFERGNVGDFHRFLSISKSSCGELLSHLYRCLDVEYLPEKEFESLSARVQEVGRVVGGLRASVGRRRMRRPLVPHSS